MRTSKPNAIVGEINVRVYFDTSATVYLVENILPWEPMIQARLAKGAKIVYSDLTRMQSIVKPLKLKNQKTLMEFDVLFSTSELIPLTASVFDRAAQIRADFGFKTPDAINLAAAVESGCDQFLANDQRLSRFPSIPIDVL